MEDRRRDGIARGARLNDDSGPLAKHFQLFPDKKPSFFSFLAKKMLDFYQ
jgi:hypothetical protein